MSKVERTATRINGFNLGELDFQLMRSLGASVYGGGAPGEIFYARGKITSDDPAQWSPAFSSLATDVDELGAQAAADGYAISARDHYWRASMYWRCAEYFARPLSPQSREYGLHSGASFANATRHMAERVQPMPYTFEGLELPGYFMQPAGSAEHITRPTVLLLTGFDGCSEELYFEAGRAALERGFNVAIAEGPGQTGALRLYPDVRFRPDYEKPISAMLDTVLAMPSVDPQRVAIYGISIGGYFVLRGAASDTRIKAVIANSPITNVRRYLGGFLDDDPSGGEDLLLEELDDVPDDMITPLQKQMFRSACLRYAANGLHDWMRILEQYTVEDMLGAIGCPALAMVGSGEGAEALAQAEQFRGGVAGPVTLKQFDGLGADMHCQMGNLQWSNAVAFDWLTQQFGQ